MLSTITPFTWRVGEGGGRERYHVHAQVRRVKKQNSKGKEGGRDVNKIQIKGYKWTDILET